MKLSLIAAAIATAALPVLAQNAPAPAEPRQARVEVADPAGNSAATPKKASKAKSSKPAKTAKKTSRKKARKKPESVG